MPNIRPTGKKYEITKHRFLELYYFCLQYNEWRDQLKYCTDTVKSIEITDMPITHSNNPPTEQLAVNRYNLSKKCELIEQTAIETEADLYQYIIKAVTNENITYNYLHMIMNIPCGKKMWYDRRRKFYWLLDKKNIKEG